MQVRWRRDDDEVYVVGGADGEGVARDAHVELGREGCGLRRSLGGDRDDGSAR